MEHRRVVIVRMSLLLLWILPVVQNHQGLRAPWHSGPNLRLNEERAARSGEREEGGGASVTQLLSGRLGLASTS